jgi:hypothetical protein
MGESSDLPYEVVTKPQVNRILIFIIALEIRMQEAKTDRKKAYSILGLYGEYLPVRILLIFKYYFTLIVSE